MINRVIGYPLDHTQSPLLHNFIYQFLNCNATMQAYAGTDLAVLMSACKRLSVSLIAVTMPFKEKILSYLDVLSPEVEELQSANTVIRREDKLLGFNTDIDGVAYALDKISLANKNVLILGAGGASRAAAYYLKKNCANLFWLNRTPKHAFSLMEKFGGKFVTLDQVSELPINIIINTTPLGMAPNSQVSPLPEYFFRTDQIIFDMVYNPVNTVLIQQAKEQGATCTSGLEMFIGQAIKQIELWLDKSIGTSQLITLIKKEFIKPEN